MKDLTRALRKYHFWILLVLVLIVSTVGWYLTRSAVARQFDQNEGKIDGAFRNMENLAREERHPNKEYLDGGDQLIEERKDSVWDAWNLKYEKQGPLFAWPESGPDVPLDKTFLEIVADLRPFETKVPYPPDPSGEELLRYTLREDYPLYIKDEFRKLAAIVGTDAAVGEDSEPEVGGFDDRTPPEEDGRRAAATADFSRIRWNAENQQQILQDHFDWSQRPDPVPTTLEILYAQEDLWVYRALMQIIRETNGGTESGGNLAIPEIEFIRIGKSATWTPAPITGYGIEAAAGKGRRQATEEGDLDEQAALHGEGSGTRRSGTQAATGDPADFRYVDMANRPLTGEQLRGTTGGAGTEQATLAVAKRIPVHMKLVINQRDINKLLVECGNSPLMVEVQQFRFNPGAGLTSMGAKRPGQGAAGIAATDPEYLPIEIYGIISMYNPVNAGALGKEVAPEEAEEEEGTEDAPDDGPEESTEETADTAVESSAEETAEEADGPAAAGGGAAATDTTDSTPAADAAESAGAP